MINSTNVSLQIINGDPDGIKICRVLGKNLIAIVIPRELLNEAKSLPAIPARGVYYLLDDNKGRLRRVYAGQTVQGIARLDSHNSRKDWWNKAVMFLAPDDEFSMDVVSGLESLAIRYIREHGAYEVDNDVDPKPYVNPYNESFINELHEDILFRMTLLGFDLDAVGDSDTDYEEAIFHTVRRGIRGLGIYRADEGTFDVLAGSQVDISTLPGTRERRNQKMLTLRDELIASGKLREDEDGIYRLTENIAFNTPSAAAVFVLGGSQNGWTEWVDSNGRTLSSVYREKESR